MRDLDSDYEFDPAYGTPVAFIEDAWAAERVMSPRYRNFNPPGSSSMNIGGFYESRVIEEYALSPNSRRFGIDDGTIVIIDGKRFSDQELTRLDDMCDDDPVDGPEWDIQFGGYGEYDSRNWEPTTVTVLFPELRSLHGGFAVASAAAAIEFDHGLGSDPITYVPIVKKKDWHFSVPAPPPPEPEDDTQYEFKGGKYCVDGFWNEETGRIEGTWIQDQNNEGFPRVRTVDGWDPKVPIEEDGRVLLPSKPTYLVGGNRGIDSVPLNAMQYSDERHVAVGKWLWRALHLYGVRAAPYSEHRVLCFADSDGNELVRDVNLGSVARGQAKLWTPESLLNQDSALFIKNPNPVRRSVGAVVSVMSNRHGSHEGLEISLDGNQWVNQIDIGDIGPGEIVGPFMVRYSPTNLNPLGLGSPRLKLSCERIEYEGE